MEKRADRKAAGAPRPAPRIVVWLPIAAMLLCATTVRAGILLDRVPAMGTSPAPASVIEISSSSLPRFDNFDGTQRSQQRVDVALLSPGRSAFGVTVGVTGLSPLRYGSTGLAPDGAGGVNLGLQWRHTLDNNRRVDVTAWRDVAGPNDALAMAQSRDAAYGARVELQLSGPRSRFVADHGFVGMQLDGGGRITVRRSAGKPMVYYRNNF